MNDDFIYVKEKSSGLTGVALMAGDNIKVYYGADDGSDDKIMSTDEFYKLFEIVEGDEEHEN